MRIPKKILILSACGACYGAVVIFKDYAGGKRYTEEHQILGKTAIVTGSTRGIGKETARELAKRGGRVILACRNMELCETVRKEIIKDTFNKNLVCKQLDLGDCESIRNFAKAVKDSKTFYIVYLLVHPGTCVQEETHLDILINNAGVMACPRVLTTEGFEWQLGVNFLGPFLLTSLLLDKLKEAPQGRIINLISPVYKRAEINFEDLNSKEEYVPKRAYGQSKLAVMLYSQELARRLQGTNVTVNCVNPGITKTNIGRHLPIGQAVVSSGILSPLLWVAMKTPSQAAQTPTYLAVDPELDKVTGKLFHNSKEVSIEKNALDVDVAKQLWLVAEKWTRLSS